METEATAKEAVKRECGNGYKCEILKKIDDVRKVWKHEALDFTNWLKEPENMTQLGEAIGITFDTGDVKTECKGERSQRRCDIVTKIGGGDADDEKEVVVIENQLEETDFSHLGRVILYAATQGANHIVWVVTEASIDHRRAIAWLNANTGKDLRFYLVEMVVYDLSDKKVAPIFRLVEGPDEERKAKESGDPHRKRNYRLWEGFVDFLDEKSDDASDMSNREKLSCINSFRQPTGENWYGISIGTGKCHIELWYSKNRIDLAILTHGANNECFGKLKAKVGELAEILKTKADDDTVGDESAAHPRLRFRGKDCNIDAESDKGVQAVRDAYKWAASGLCALVPKVREIIGAK